MIFTGIRDQRRHILLMTATVTPRQTSDLTRTDPTLRLSDYQRALKYYLKLVDTTLHGIVFVENSNSNVVSLKDMTRESGKVDRVEFLCNYGDHSYSDKGRAFGEFKLLDHAMAESSMIRAAHDQAVIWKITGRYIVKNLRAVIARSPDQFDAYFDMKDRPLRWMDMRLMAWTPAGYDRIFRGVADELQSRLNEWTMREFVPKRAPEALLVQRFRNEPLVDGIRGYDNRNYSKGRNLLKFCIRSASRAIAPWYWI